MTGPKIKEVTLASGVKADVVLTDDGMALVSSDHGRTMTHAQHAEALEKAIGSTPQAGLATASFENTVTDVLAGILECDRGDAQGIAEVGVAELRHGIETGQIASAVAVAIDAASWEGAR